MKKQWILIAMSCAISITTLSACGGPDAQVTGALNSMGKNPAPANNSTNPTPVPTTGSTANCANFSGSYAAVGMATLTLVQNGCSSIVYTEACTGDAGFCNAFGIQNVSFTLPLDGSTNSNGYSGTISSGTLTITQTTGSNSQVQSIQLSDHPCDPSNSASGLEAQVTSTQSSGGVSVSSSSCQPWSKM